jgi:hypothetical protein
MCAVMSRYEPLTRYLESRRGMEASLTFREVEAILQRNLPNSARRHQAWWSNTTTHSHADAWLRIGWKTSKLDLAGQRVVFVQDRPFAPPPTATSLAFELAEATPSIVTLRLDDLSPAAEALVLRQMAERGVSADRAIRDLLHEAAIDRRRRLLERFPLEGPRSRIDSVDLIREDRDAR